MSESERQAKIRLHFYAIPNVTGMSFLPDRVQVKLKHGTPQPSWGYLEGIRVEYVYEEPSPFGAGVPIN